jgi:uncharacterized protein (TIGR03067 family)
MTSFRWLVAACALALVGADGPEDLARKELGKFQGSWVAESIQIGPKKTPDEALKSFRLVVEGDSWIVKTPGEKKSKLRLDPSKSPKHLDLVDEIGGKERITKCIYEFKDDTLSVCRPYMQMNADRPAKIQAGGDFVGVTVWKREKK